MSPSSRTSQDSISTLGLEIDSIAQIVFFCRNKFTLIKTCITVSDKAEQVCVGKTGPILVSVLTLPSFREP